MRGTAPPVCEQTSPAPVAAAIRGFNAIEPGGALPRPDVLIVAVGAFCGLAVDTADRLAKQGIDATVVDPRWVLPVAESIVDLARRHRLVVTLEDSGVSGGVGAAT